VVFRGPQRAWPGWDELMARPSEAPHRKEWNVSRVRAWTVRDGFNVVWLELAPSRTPVAERRRRADQSAAGPRASRTSTARNSALFDWNTNAAGNAGF